MLVRRAADEARSAGSKRRDLIAQLAEQDFQLIAAAVDIADDIERPMLVAFVVVERHPFDDCGLDFLWALQHEDVPEAFFGESAQGPTQLRMLLANHMRTKVAFVAQSIP